MCEGVFVAVIDADADAVSVAFDDAVVDALEETELVRVLEDDAETVAELVAELRGEAVADPHADSEADSVLKVVWVVLAVDVDKAVIVATETVALPLDVEVEELVDSTDADDVLLVEIDGVLVGHAVAVPLTEIVDVVVEEEVLDAEADIVLVADTE